MKRIIRFTYLIFVAFSMNSCFFSCQDLVLSPAVGIDASQLSEESDYGNTDGDGSLIGLQLGLDALAPINEQFSIESGLRYAAKGGKSSYGGDGDFEGEEAFNFEDKTRLNYLDIPVLARYHFSSTGFSAYGGIQPAILLGAKQRSSGSESDNQSTNVKDNYKTLDMAGSIGVGYQFENGIRLNLGYDHGFVNISKNESFGVGSINNRTLKLSVGYTLGRKKVK